MGELEVLLKLFAFGDVLSDAEVRLQIIALRREGDDVEEKGLGDGADYDVLLGQTVLGRHRMAVDPDEAGVGRRHLLIRRGQELVVVELEKVQGRLVEVEELSARVEDEDGVERLLDQCPVLFLADPDGLFGSAPDVDSALGGGTERVSSTKMRTLFQSSWGSRVSN